MDEKGLAERLCQQFNTRDPFIIADGLGYCILRVPLVDIRGFYQRVNRRRFIYICSTLDERQARFVCAHELGHSLLHKKLNRIFMDTRTHMLSNRYEKEADRFAADLIYDDSDLQTFFDIPIETIADCLGISQELAEYRMSRRDINQSAKK